MANLKSLILFIQMVCSVFATSSWATSSEEFCQTYLEIQKKSPSKISLKESLKLAFFPSSIIYPVELKEGLEENADVISGNKYIFVHLPSPQFDSILVQKIKSLEKEVGRLEIFLKLKSIKEMKSCLSVVSQNGNDFGQVQDYIEFYLKHQNQMEAYNESKSMEILTKKLKAFKRKGWIISYVNQIHEMYEELESDSKVSEVMVIAHSDQFGRLYDAKKNIFPKGAFANLPATVKKLIFYSCHPEEVIDYYNIKSYLYKFDVYYPQVEKKFESLFETKTPIQSIRAFKNISKRKSFVSPMSGPACQLNISSDKKFDGLGVSLNDQFLGFIQTDKSSAVNFDCLLISRNKNQFKFFDIGNTERPPLGDWNVVLINNQGEEQKLILKEYLTWDQKKHLLTIGH